MTEKSNYRYLFIINPVAGIGGKKHFPEMIMRVFGEMDVIVETCFTTGRGDASRLVWENWERFDVFVAVGGDGTVNEVISAVAGTEKLFSLIPAGSGNALGRELGLSMWPARALKEMVASHLRIIDTGKVNGRRFVNVCGVGFDAHIAGRFAKSKIRGPLPYVAHVLRDFMSYQPHWYRITIDGKTFRRKAFVVTVANTSQFGNNAYIAPRAKIDDGLLDICILKPFPVGVVPDLALRLFNGQLDHSKYCEYHQGKEILIEGETLGYQVDGEPIVNSQPLQLSVDGKSLNILVPGSTRKFAGLSFD
jgi:diacylglycerol kinase (ATP)